MTLAKRRPALARSVATVLIATLLTGCTIWEPVPLTPQVLDDATRAGVRVTLIDGTRMTVRQPFVFDDHLVGERFKNGGGLGRVAFRANEIAMIETGELDATGTAGIFVGSVYAFAILVLAFLNNP